MHWTGQGVRYVQYPSSGTPPTIDQVWETAFPGIAPEQIHRPKSSLPMGTIQATQGQFAMAASIQPGRVDLYISWGENGDIPEPPEPLIERAVEAARRCVPSFEFTRIAFVVDVFERADSWEDASRRMRAALPEVPFPKTARDLKFGLNAPTVGAETQLQLYRLAEWTTSRAQRLAPMEMIGQPPTIIDQFHVFALQVDCSPPPSNQSMDMSVGLIMIDDLAIEVRSILNSGFEHLT